MYYLAIPLIAVALAGLSLSAPFTPSGGLDSDPSVPPVYEPMSDYDFQSLNLALNQALLEVDLFHFGLAQFSEEFQQAGLSPDDQFLIEYMADQNAGHATLLSNVLGSGNGSTTCNYSFPIETTEEFIDFGQKVALFGESGTYGFLEHLNSRATASLLLSTVSIEARQALIFRQLQGLFPMPIWFSPAITQSMQWTLLAPYIVSCSNSTPVQFQNFPALNISVNPNVSEITNGSTPAITTNLTAFTGQGLSVNLTWDSPGVPVGPNNSYTTNSTAGAAQFVAWISQLNTTYTPLTNISGNSGLTQQPGGLIFGNGTAPLINGTVFVLVTDNDTFVTPGNITELNQHVVAGPALYTAG